MKDQLLLLPFFIIGWLSFWFKGQPVLQGCQHLHPTIGVDTSHQEMFPTIPEHLYDSIFSSNPEYWSSGYDFPVGKPDGEGYVLSQRFGQNNHLGEDWNGKGGGNTDLGDPVFSISEGLVTFSRSVCCGWGNVIRIVHFQPNHPEMPYVESVYAHLQDLEVVSGQFIKRGQKVGTIGNANGIYPAHLHLEIRSFISMSLGPGYSDNHFGFLIPTDYIRQNR